MRTQSINHGLINFNYFARGFDLSKESVSKAWEKLIQNEGLTQKIKTRKRNVVVLKQAFIHYVHSVRMPNPQLKPFITYTDLGRAVGGMDHSTILHSIRKHEQDLKFNDDQAIEAKRTIIKFFSNY